MSRVAFLGGNGLAIELFEYMRCDGVQVAGYYAPEIGELSTWAPYLGDERESFDPQLEYVIASGLPLIRQRMISFIEEKDVRLFSYISSRSYISDLANIGKGTVILPNAIIAGDPSIGDYFLMNVDTFVGHQSELGCNVVLAPGAKVTGQCVLGNNVMLGTNAVLIPGTHIGNDSEIGIGAVPHRRVKSSRYVKAPDSKAIDISIIRNW